MIDTHHDDRGFNFKPMFSRWTDDSRICAVDLTHPLPTFVSLQETYPPVLAQPIDQSKSRHEAARIMSLTQNSIQKIYGMSGSSDDQSFVPTMQVLSCKRIASKTGGGDERYKVRAGRIALGGRATREFVIARSRN